MSTIIFESTHGSVVRHTDGEMEIRCNNDHSLMMAMAKEIEKLREQLAAAQKLAEVGSAIDRAQKELPEGHHVEITVANSRQYATLYHPHAYDPFGDTLAEQINDAVEKAKENG